MSICVIINGKIRSVPLNSLSSVFDDIMLRMNASRYGILTIIGLTSLGR